MPDIMAAQAPDPHETPGTKAGQFLARRGVLLLKEFRDIGNLMDNYGAKLSIKTYIVSIAKSSTTQPDISHSIGLNITRDKQEQSALLDFEELEELDKAIAYIGKIAAKIGGEKRDYTEIIYCTKDNIKFGFYQTTNRLQVAFINLGHSANFFTSIAAFDALRGILKEASDHLVSKGSTAKT